MVAYQPSRTDRAEARSAARRVARCHLPQGCLILIALLSLPVFASVATAQWTVTNLHPAGALSSQANAVSGTQQAGWAYYGAGHYHAGVWNGAAASFVDLNPAGADSSSALANSATQQAGSAAFSGGQGHAGLWSATAVSWVDLNPTSASASAALAISGAQ